MKLNKVLFLLPAVAVLLFSCAPNLDLLSGGTLVGVDADKHFSEDLSYDEDGTTISKYMKDGSFIISTLSFEGEADDNDNDGKSNEGWIQTGGSKGTYTYDTTTKTLYQTPTHKFRSIGAEMVWDPLTNDNDVVLSVDNRIFTSTKVYPIAGVTTDSFKTFEYSSISTFKEGSTMLYYYKFTANADNTAMEMLDIMKTTDSSNNITFGSEKTTSYSIIDIFPAGINIGANQSPTVNMEQTQKITRMYNPSITNWATPSTNTDHSLYSQAFICGDNYVIFQFIDTTAQRNK